MQTIQQFPSWFSKQKLSGKVAIGCAGLFTLCCLCSVPIAILNPATPTPEAANTSVVVQTEEPAEIPTNTLLPIPTVTFPPEPTVTFTPEPTITPVSTQDSYEIFIGEKVSDYAIAFFEVNEYVQMAGNNPSLILDSEWKTKLGFALGILNFRADEMAKLEPTPKYANLHSIIVHLADETHLFTDAYANGIDNFDSALIEKASQHLINMTALMQDATAEIDKIKATP
jgi:hypothetical protein